MTGDVVQRLTSLRQHRGDGRRAPHKPLLVLLALGQLSATGSSSLPWTEVETRLGALLAEFGTPTSAGAPWAAYPFTRLRADGVWELSRDVANDTVGPLRAEPIEGHFPADIEATLVANPSAISAVARTLVESQFPSTLMTDVLLSVGLDPETVFGMPPASRLIPVRKRDVAWRHAVLAAWDRSCAFCGFDGSVGGAPVGIEAAHVRWFTIGGPDELDNGVALCSLHHKLFDRGALGLDHEFSVVVSTNYAAVSDMGRTVYELHGRALRPRPGTKLPAAAHVQWHTREVFKGESLSA